jgi:Flp pilus assembly protein TadD
VLETLGKPEEALDALDKATELNPKDSEAWYRKGMVLQTLGKEEEALKAFDKTFPRAVVLTEK